MNKKNILFPTDFSTASDAALIHAENFAKQSSATLVVLHVEEPPLAYGGGELYYGLPEPSSERILEMLKNVCPHASDISFEHRLVMGDPASEIVRVAKEEHPELIVLGTHGRTGLSRILMGSVAEAVMRHAPCPVLIYRLNTNKLSPK